MDTIPDRVDLSYVLGDIKDNEEEWRDTFAQRLLKGANKSDAWFRNFLKLDFFIEEITGKNAKKYHCTWGNIITALDHPTEIKIEHDDGNTKNVSDKVKDFLGLPEVINKYTKQPPGKFVLKAY